MPHQPTPGDQRELERLLAQPAPGAAEQNASAEQDEIYLKIWDLEQQQATTRWTVTTFFLSVSFAIFGFSFQASLAAPFPDAARLSGLAIYLFGYVLFLRFNVYTRFLRGYLRNLEARGRTSLDIQTQAAVLLRGRPRRSATWLLGYFAALYMLAVVVLWRLGP